jgi:hypothetical protein
MLHSPALARPSEYRNVLVADAGPNFLIESAIKRKRRVRCSIATV